MLLAGLATLFLAPPSVGEDSVATQDDQLSKRERQKQRREAKLAEQRRQQAKARRNRFIALAAVAIVALAALGAVIAGRVAERRAADEQAAAVTARLEELGCTEVTEQPDLGQGHIGGDPASLAAAPPEALYPDRPATSGQHFQSWVTTGVYDQPIDERILVHNLEHGYVNLYYGQDADPGQVEQLRTFAQEQIDGDFPKIVVAPAPSPLPDGANFASVAWTFRQLCGQFDPDVAEVFLRDHHNGEPAPERYLPPHIAEGSGIDPAAQDGPLLLPPLGDETVTEPGMEEGQTEVPAQDPAAGTGQADPASEG